MNVNIAPKVVPRQIRGNNARFSGMVVTEILLLYTNLATHHQRSISASPRKFSCTLGIHKSLDGSRKLPCDRCWADCVSILASFARRTKYSGVFGLGFRSGLMHGNRHSSHYLWNTAFQAGFCVRGTLMQIKRVRCTGHLLLATLNSPGLSA